MEQFIAGTSEVLYCDDCKYAAFNDLSWISNCWVEERDICEGDFQDNRKIELKFGTIHLTVIFLDAESCHQLLFGF